MPTATGLNNAQVQATSGGVFYMAPVGSTAPTDANVAPDAAFLNLGYTTTEGLVYTPNNKETDVFAMQNGGVQVMVAVTEASEEYKFAALQINSLNMGLAFGTSVTQTATSGSYVTNPALPATIQRAFIFDIISGASIERIYIPRAVLIKPPAQNFVTGEANKLEYTLKAFSDSTINGFSKRWNTALATGN